MSWKPSCSDWTMPLRMVPDVSIVHDVVRELMEEKARQPSGDSSGGDAGKSDGAGRR